MSQPPPLPLEPRKSSTRGVKIIIAGVCSVLIIGGVCIFFVIQYIRASGITRPFDDKFGDQHLKTTVALLELHKIRYGRYVVSLDGAKYCVEVERGWIGKPVLSYPAEFWQGTGYSSDLCSHSQ